MEQTKQTVASTKLTREELLALYHQQALYFVREDGSDVMVGDNGYSLLTCLQMYDHGTSFYLDEPEELAVCIADRYISVQKTDDGYDYTIYDVDYQELSNGTLENDMDILGALRGIVKDLKSQTYEDIRGSILLSDMWEAVDYGELLERAEAEPER